MLQSLRKRNCLINAAALTDSEYRFELWELLLAGGHILHDLCEVVECLQFRWQVSKLCRLWNDAIIGENHNTFPAVCVELLLRLFQFFSRRRQCKRDSLVSVKVGMQTKGNPEEIVGLFRKISGTGWCSSHFAILQHITTSDENTVFTLAHHSSDTGKVQHFKHAVRYSVQFGNKIVLCVKPAEGSIICGIHYMITVGFCAGCQISQILQRDDAAVGAYFLLYLH